MIVLARPAPCIQSLIHNNPLMPSKLNLCQYRLGRHALLSSLVSLGLISGDSVIIPAYMCDSSISPLRMYGLKLVFMDVDKNMKLPVDVVKQLIEKDDSIKAVLVVHYFGLTKNIDEIVKMCHGYGIKVVEDASHSFLSHSLSDSASTRGDAEVFSIRKSLPVPDGGASKINNNTLARKDIFPCVSLSGELKYLGVRALEKLASVLGINVYSNSIDSIKKTVRSLNKKIDHMDIDANICKASWQLRRYLNDEQYLRKSQCAISENFNKLNKILCSLGFRTFVESDENLVAPQACVVFDDKGGLTRYLRKNGIGAWSWPGEEIPQEVIRHKEKYPNSVFFNKNLVLVPIHQDLNDKSIEYIIQVFSKLDL